MESRIWHKACDSEVPPSIDHRSVTFLGYLGVEKGDKVAMCLGLPVPWAPKLHELRDELPKSAVGKLVPRESREQELQKGEPA